VGDADGDGVTDDIDRCPDTPLGFKVDCSGCPIDSDGDGVPDGIDRCPRSPKGAKVDASGCCLDADKDGVPDGIDKCPDTPKGATVDDRGCPSDSDRDGVIDGLDKCPDTPAGAKVDAAGCPLKEMVRQLLNTGAITTSKITFDLNKATLKPESEPVLNEIGEVLSQYPGLKIEIGGHTDNSGSAAGNEKLSGARAKAVLDYLVKNFPKIDAASYTAKGYGESQPIATNDTAEGRAQNRRVEFKVLNAEEIQKQLDQQQKQ
jgi:OOP family OmpA-OmpF porin